MGTRIMAYGLESFRDTYLCSAYLLSTYIGVQNLLVFMSIIIIKNLNLLSMFLANRPKAPEVLGCHGWINLSLIHLLAAIHGRPNHSFK